MVVRNVGGIMELSNFTLEQLIQTAIKSEIDSKRVYSTLSGRVKNYVLKDRLNFLADEELKHREFLESFYQKKFPGEELIIPDESPVPLPMVNIENESMKISELFFQAMEAEKASHDFYLEFSNMFMEEKEIKNMLTYLASMEMNHYNILKTERDSIDLFEEYETEWPFIHMGP